MLWPAQDLSLRYPTATGARWWVWWKRSWSLVQFQTRSTCHDCRSHDSLQHWAKDVNLSFISILTFFLYFWIFFPGLTWLIEKYAHLPVLNQIIQIWSAHFKSSSSRMVAFSTRPLNVLNLSRVEAIGASPFHRSTQSLSCVSLSVRFKFRAMNVMRSVWAFALGELSCDEACSVVRKDRWSSGCLLFIGIRRPDAGPPFSAHSAELASATTDAFDMLAQADAGNESKPLDVVDLNLCK